MASYTVSNYVKLDAHKRQKCIKDFATEKVDSFLETFIPVYLPNLFSTGLLRDHIVEVIKYNVVGGKMTRGTLAADIFLQTVRFLFSGLLEDSNFSEELFNLAIDICLVQEILQGAFLMIDDVIDHSTIRRGKPSWRAVVGDEQAVNDGLILWQIADSLVLYLEDKCGKTLKIFEVYHQAKANTTLGQHLDTFTKTYSQRHTMGHLNDTYILKTAYYTFYLPLIMGYRSGVLFGNMAIGTTAASEKGYTMQKVDSILNLQQRLDTDIEQQIHKISMDLGRLYQMQDDFLDFYAPEILHKESSDYLENKATWTLVRALELSASEEARGKGVSPQTILTIYGKRASEKESIQKLFDALDLKSIYIHEASALLKQCKEEAASMPPYISDSIEDVFDMLSSRINVEIIRPSK
ncbi:Trans-isoprenyl diphosphate synthase [Giardia duodenalis]|uniref:Trans-isoprenyl diphosphate synthase n=1 Tax=Giardia intestinalis TaxID=5741 RepID=V6TEG1_GIAIN|nr:Trans-isoprenyl diphosphate synthase [Giardia intestinalis]